MIERLLKARQDATHVQKWDGLFSGNLEKNQEFLDRNWDINFQVTLQMDLKYLATIMMHYNN